MMGGQQRDAALRKAEGERGAHGGRRREDVEEESEGE